MRAAVREEAAKDFYMTSVRLLRSAERIFGPRHECVRNNITSRVEVTSDQRRVGRGVSLSHPEWVLLKRRAAVSGMSVSGFVRKSLGLNPPNADLCPCSASDGLGSATTEDEIWREIEGRSPIRRDEGYGFEGGEALLLPGPDRPDDDDDDDDDVVVRRPGVPGSGEGNTGWMPPSAEDEDREYEELVRRGLLDPEEEEDDDDDDDGGGYRDGAGPGENEWTMMPPSDDDADFEDDEDDDDFEDDEDDEDDDDD